MSWLAGKRIVNTRALHQASEFDALLRTHNAIPISYPCIAIVPPDDTTPLDSYLTVLNQFDWLILTSTNALLALQNRLIQRDIVPDWERIRVAVIGRKTAQAFCTTFQHEPDFVPEIFTAESLSSILPIRVGERVFLPQSALADNRVANILTERGAVVICAIAYQTIIGTGGDDVPAMLKRGEIDVLIFTSPSTVKHFMQRIYPQTIPDLPIVCIGPSTADTATKLGFSCVLVPAEYTLQAMIDTLNRYYQERAIG